MAAGRDHLSSVGTCVAALEPAAKRHKVPEVSEKRSCWRRGLPARRSESALSAFRRSKSRAAGSLRPSYKLGDWRTVMLLPTSSYKAVPGEMPPEVVGQKTSDRSVCGLARRSTGWRGGGRHAFSWARRRDTGFIEASGAMFFLLRRAIGDWYPFFPVASRGNPADTRGRPT